MSEQEVNPGLEQSPPDLELTTRIHNRLQAEGSVLQAGALGAVVAHNAWGGQTQS